MLVFNDTLQGFFWDSRHYSKTTVFIIRGFNGFPLSLLVVFGVRFATHLSSFNASSNPNPKESSLYIMVFFIATLLFEQFIKKQKKRAFTLLRCNAITRHCSVTVFKKVFITVSKYLNLICYYFRYQKPLTLFCLYVEVCLFG